MTGSSTRPTEGKTVQARVLAYAQKIGWTYVPREEAERRRRFLLHPNPLPEDEAREMMEQQLMTAQIRVHDLDLDEILHNLLQKLVPGRFNRFGEERSRPFPTWILHSWGRREFAGQRRSGLECHRY